MNHFRRSSTAILCAFGLFGMASCKTAPRDLPATEETKAQSRGCVVIMARRQPEFHFEGQNLSQEDLSRLKVRLKSFTGQSVQEALVSWFSKRLSPSNLFSPPQEYSDLIELGKIAVPSLIELLGNEEGVFRLAAYMALVEITNKRFGSTEDFCADSPANQEQRKSAFNQWNTWWQQNRNKSRVQWFIDDLASADETTKKSAAIELGFMNDTSAVSALKKLLADRKFSFYAAESLGRLGDESAIPHLIDLYLQNDSEGYRRTGIELLQKLTGETFGYVPNGSQASRERSIQQWKEWWQKRSKQLQSK